MEEDIKILKDFINQYKETQEMYKDDEIQAEIERSCYFEEVPAIAIENVLNEFERLKIENKNISRELLARTEKLNEYYKQNKIGEES